MNRAGLDAACPAASFRAARRVEPSRVAPLVAFLAIGCVASSPSLLPGPVPPRACASAAEVTYSVFLVGDAGGTVLPKHPEAELPVDRVLRNLRDDVMEQAGALGVARVAVVYLGDNVHPDGLAPVGLAGRSRGERVLRQQITSAGPARVIFLAGDQDWGDGGASGWERVRAQQGFLSTHGERVSMLPPGGCSGPARVDLGEHLRFVFIDPIGLGDAIEAPARQTEVCSPGTAADALLALDREMERPEGRHLVLALHPPLVTAGPESARRTLPRSRQAGASGGDVAADVYAKSASAIHRALRPRRPLLVAGGHEHNLQLHRDVVGAYYLVSGAGSASQVNEVEVAASALYAEAVPGYARLDAHADGALSLTITAIRGERRETALRHCLAEGPPS